MERKLYKTKLCILYQRGRCSRDTCSFAHGDAELRRLAGPVNVSGRRDYRGGGLRDNIERRHSPYRRFSPGRDGRVHHSFHNHKQVTHDRGYSPSSSPMRRSDRINDKRKQVDSQSDISRSPRASYGDQEHIREAKRPSNDEKIAVEEKLKEAQEEIEVLEENKCKLQTILKAKVEESDKLSTKIEELELQISNEKEDCRRLISKNKKFIKALRRYIRAQEEIKRSQARLQRLVGQFDSSSIKHGANEEDYSANMLSDVELNQNGTRYEQNYHASPLKKRSRLSVGTSEETKTGRARNLDRFVDLPTRKQRLFLQTENNQKELKVSSTVLIRDEGHELLPNDHNKQQKGKSSLSGTPDKVNLSEFGASLPASSTAAQAVDDLIKAVEIDEKSEALNTRFAPSQNGFLEDKTGLPYLPPPPPPPLKAISNTYNQYEGDDVEVDIEEVDMENADITNG